MHYTEGRLSPVGGAANIVPAHPLDVEEAVFGGETYRFLGGVKRPDLLGLLGDSYKEEGPLSPLATSWTI